MTKMELGSNEKVTQKISAKSEGQEVKRGWTIKSPKFIASEGVKILWDGGPGDAVFGIAKNYDGNKTKVMRWNGTKERPFGFPLSCGRPCWMAIPDNAQFFLELSKSFLKD